MIIVRVIKNEDNNSCDVCSKKHQEIVEIVAPYNDTLVIGKRCRSKFIALIVAAKPEQETANETSRL